MKVDRRRFLAGAALVPAATVLTAHGLDTLRPAATAAAVNSGPAANYLEGRVVGAAPGVLQVRDRWSTKAPLVTLRVTPQTDICKGACRLGQDAIRVGDRVDARTFDLPDGTRGAPWIVVNLVAFMGKVMDITKDGLLVQRTKHSCRQRVHFGPASTVRIGEHEMGATPAHFQVGDPFMLTGSAAIPTDDGDVFATLVIKM